MELNKVIEKIKPEKIKAKSFLDELNNSLEKNKINAKAVIGGSLAKDTYLNNPDVDIFVKFDIETYKNKDISKILAKVLKPLKPTKVHGSRDYYQIERFEIVPVLDCKNSTQVVNVTDMSPLHALWVKKHIKKLNNDVRLLKQFCKANNLYGAESYINGFSGYILEIMIIHYGSFKKFINSASKWKPKVIIDIEKHYKNGKIILQKLNKAKIISPLIIIDPVQAERNVAASVSIENFNKMATIAKAFKKKPSYSFFKEKKITISDLNESAKKNKTKITILNVTALTGNQDIVGTKLLKAFEFINKQLKLNDFKIIKKGWNLDMFWFELENDTLSKTKKHQGPLIHLNDKDIKAFKKKHGKGVFIDGDRFAVIINRKFDTAKKFFSYIIKQREVKSRVKSIKC